MSDRSDSETGDPGDRDMDALDVSPLFDDGDTADWTQELPAEGGELASGADDVGAPSPEEIAELVESHLEYAKALALKTARNLPSHVDAADLIASAQLGLTQAAQRYRAGSGAAFTTFAYYRIRGAVFDWIRKSTWLPPEAPLIDDLIETSLGAIDAEATLDAAAEAFRRSVRALGAVVLFSDLAAKDEDGGELDPAAEDDTGSDLERQELLARLRRAVVQLDEKHRALLDELYTQGKSMSELALERGVNKSTISRQHVVLVERLRELLGADPPDPPGPR